MKNKELLYNRYNSYINQKFGRWTAIKPDGLSGNGGVMFLCKCDCGTIRRVRISCLKVGSTKSCGCLNRENAVIRGRYINYKHGYYKSKTYNTWCAMIQRCNNPNNEEYKNYGNRGIKICDRWMDFKNFLEDMGDRPCYMYLDRIDNNMGYYKENCKWSTIKEQNRNKRTNIMISINGKTQSLIDWCEELGLYYPTIHTRIYSYKWSFEEALELTERRKKYGSNTKSKKR